MTPQELSKPIRLDSDFRSTCEVLARHLSENPRCDAPETLGWLLRLSHCSLDSIVATREAIGGSNPYVTPTQRLVDV